MQEIVSNPISAFEIKEKSLMICNWFKWNKNKKWYDEK